MDNEVITMLAKYSDTPCPSFKYENPLLDKNVADSVAKGFIKILNGNELTKENYRKIVLECIRKSCKVEPPGHIDIDDTLTEMLRNAYIELSDSSNINKDLDAFFIRNLKDINLNSLHTPSLKPEVIQALVNLNSDKTEVHNIVLKDIIHWNFDDSKESIYSDILKSMWNMKNVNGISEGQPDDISIKTKPLIERILLENALEFLTTLIVDDDWLEEVVELQQLIMMCTVSSECFQLSCSIMNAIFIKTNFHEQMQRFIELFMNSIKFKVNYVSQLYPVNLQHIVLLLDIELNGLKGEIKQKYMAYTLEHLINLHEQCESDLIMLLSHFKQWFNLYYNNRVE